MEFDSYFVEHDAINATDLKSEIKERQLSPVNLFYNSWTIEKIRISKSPPIIGLQLWCSIKLLPPHLIYQYEMESTGRYAVYCNNDELAEDLTDKIFSPQSLEYIGEIIRAHIQRSLIELWNKTKEVKEIKLTSIDPVQPMNSENELRIIENTLRSLLSQSPLS